MPVHDSWRHAADDMQRMLRLKHRSYATEKAYLGWSRNFYRFVKGIDPEVLGPEHVRDYLSYLAIERGVTVSTQNQAFNALLFFSAMPSTKRQSLLEGLFAPDKAKDCRWY